MLIELWHHFPMLLGTLLQSNLSKTRDTVLEFDQIHLEIKIPRTVE